MSGSEKSRRVRNMLFGRRLRIPREWFSPLNNPTFASEPSSAKTILPTADPIPVCNPFAASDLFGPDAEMLNTNVDRPIRMPKARLASITSDSPGFSQRRGIYCFRGRVFFAALSAPYHHQLMLSRNGNLRQQLLSGARIRVCLVETWLRSTDWRARRGISERLER